MILGLCVFLYSCRCVFYLQIVILKHYVVVCVYAFYLRKFIFSFIFKATVKS